MKRATGESMDAMLAENGWVRSPIAAQMFGRTAGDGFTKLMAEHGVLPRRAGGRDYWNLNSLNDIKDKVPPNRLTTSNATTYSGKRKATLKDMSRIIDELHEKIDLLLSANDELNKRVDSLVGRLSTLEIKQMRVKEAEQPANRASDFFRTNVTTNIK